MTTDLARRRPDGRLAAAVRALPALAPWAVVALALALRLAHLGTPRQLLVDERYYVAGARQLLERGYEASSVTPVPGELPAVHPPLGKWMIALGIRALGDQAVGWRIACALAGTATVALVYLCGRRLFAGRGAALAAAFLLAVEDLSVVQSRAAMLDALVTFWIVAGVYALLRDAAEARAGGDRPRRWRFAAGALLGCAAATKWSGVYVLVAALLGSLVWEAVVRRRAGVPAPLRHAFLVEGASLIEAFALLPLAVYLASYTGTFVAGGVGPQAWLEDQLRMLDFHATLREGHAYASSALSWLVMRRPFAYFYARPAVATAAGPVPGAQEVLALGHPLVFLAITPVAVWAAVRWLRRHDHALAVPLLLALALWLPWAVQQRPMFVYYMTPVVPFVVLLQGAALARLARWRPVGAVLAGAVLALAAWLLWYHWPVLTGVPIPYERWAVRVAAWHRIPLWRPDWV
ncbi:MAG TPA: phospholipid carrier-dependent glycosyltransferase [Actinomycetes bacterium]|nr:phospholipid carrier-dependent glycosyltransferase [Actinomycetes bacterium]